jgi:hypothetical protein
MTPTTPTNKPIECAACFFKEHRPPIDEAWIGALIGMVMFDLVALCAEHREAAIRIGQAAAGKQARTAAVRLRVLDGGRAPRREPPRPGRRP